MTLRAMGAATLLPLSPFSTTTATAIFGSSSGPKATNKRVVAHALGDIGRLVLLVLGDGEHLRRAALARHLERRVEAHGARRAARAVHDAVHALDDRVPVRGIRDLDGRQGLRGHGAHRRR